MSGRLLKEKLARGESVHGTFFQYTSNPAVVDVLPDEGLDFVVLNTEHNALEMADFLPLHYALKAKNICSLVRIHSRDFDDVAKACDSFDGVVVPYAEDVEQFKRLAAAGNRRPLKGAALEDWITTGTWPSDATREYVEQLNAGTVFAPMIESPTSVENLSEICQIHGVDAVFVGPNDLSVSMGIPEERDHPDFVAMIQRIIDIAEAQGVAAGCHFSKLEHAQRLIEQGARFIPFGSDISMLKDGIAHTLETLRGSTVEQGDKII